MPRKSPPAAPPSKRKPQSAVARAIGREGRDTTDLVIITGMSGSGKASALKAFEDLGYYCVDNLPIDLIPQFAQLAMTSSEIERTAIVVDVREGQSLEKFPRMLQELRKSLSTKLIFLEAKDDILVRRYSETRRPHPMGRSETVPDAITAERTRLEPIRNVADVVIDTSKLNVHELRAHIIEKFGREAQDHARSLMTAVVSFGFKNGVPSDVDLVFDVRFLPNPHFIPEFRPLTGKNAKVAKYVRSFPQTREFLKRTDEMLKFLLPYYIREGKTYLTIGIGCTGGQHRSVMIAEELGKSLAKAGYNVKTIHRDAPNA
ncbi:MAG: RNase adapter RapZ [Acidobacteriaceae bacterium]